MKLPQSITITNSSYLLDGGTTTLCAVCDLGNEVHIQLAQHVFPSPVAGRLFFGEELIAVRSPVEDAIVKLLDEAEILPSALRLPDGEPIQLSEDRISFVEEIDELAANIPADNLRRQLNAIVAYVQSDEYVTVARKGVPEKETLTIPDDYSSQAFSAKLVVSCDVDCDLNAILHEVLNELGCSRIGSSTSNGAKSCLYHDPPYVLVSMGPRKGHTVSLRATYNRQAEGEWLQWLDSFSRAVDVRPALACEIHTSQAG